MSDHTIIKNKAEFEATAQAFLNKIFNPVLENNLGDMEIRTFPNGQWPEQYFCHTVKEAAEIAFDLCNSGIDVYFGANPRTGKRGKKENVHYVTAFHAEIDYGSDGHEKPTVYENYDEAIKAITKFKPQPTLINHSGGGHHCYWVLGNPLKKDEIGVKELESINKFFLTQLGGDKGTHNLDRVLRIPGTYNFKLPDNPRQVRVINKDGPVYDFDDFKAFINIDEPKRKDTSARKKSESVKDTASSTWDGDIDKLTVSDRIKDLIKNGNDGTYSSRSEADQAVITALVHKGVGESDIKAIFQSYPNGIGEKYKDHSSPDEYLSHNISKAKEMSNLTPAEMLDPLFISGSISKDKNNRYQLNVVEFEEYIVEKFKLKYLEKEKAFFKYSGKCYEQCSDDYLNFLCQKELGKHRKRFTKSVMYNFIHFCIADDLVDSDKARNDQVIYLTLQNGLFDLVEETLISHTPEIFTTNLLPYDYEPSAQCPMWQKYLDDIFMGDKDKIIFAQESIGYAFLKEIPKPAVFFLIGSGSNGKSVFVNTISNLFGDENVSTISLNQLTNEYYTLGLFGKMVNISSETPHKKQINTDMVKAAVAGDWISGRNPYKEPTKFKPYAKHFLSMNQIPKIDDTSHGWWRRIYILEFLKEFSEDEMDVHLTDKLKTELSGIFNWALDGYKRLRKNNFIFSKGISMQKSKQQYKNQSNSVFAFISHYLEKTSEDSRVMLKNTYELYQSFCNTEGERDVLTKPEFQGILRSNGYKIDNSSKHSNAVCIFGVRVKNV
jgi:putative DNA primase/helicase